MHPLRKSLLAVLLLVAAAPLWAGPKLKLQSEAFQNKKPIPVAYGCEGRNLPPVLTWTGEPEGTKSLMVMVEDVDYGMGQWVHWMVFNIPAGVGKLDVGDSHKTTMPDGTRQGLNSYGGIGWAGPCPPRGERHRYLFRLYALDTTFNLKQEAGVDELMAALDGHILGKSHLTGSFQR